MTRPAIALVLSFISAALAGAVRPDENLLANARFESDQLEEPAFWMVTHGKTTYSWKASGGPGGVPAVRFDSALDPSQTESTLTQFGLQLWEKGRYRLSGWVRAENLQCQRGGFTIANMGWTMSGGFEFARGTYGWRRFEKEIDCFPSKGNTWIASFYIVKMSGAVELANVRIEPVGEETCRRSSTSALAAAQRQLRLVPCAPLLDEIPADAPRVTFQHFGDLPDDLTPAACDLVLACGKAERVAPLAEGPQEIELPPGAGAAGAFDARIRVRATGRTLFSRTYACRFVVPCTEDGPQLRRLNNLVVELVRQKLDPAQNAEISFALAHDGWVFIQAAATAVTVDGALVLDSTTPRGETFRRLKRGRHRLVVTRPAGGEVIVRRIPEILYYRPGNANNLPVNTDYGWEFQERYVLPGATTMNAGDVPAARRADVRRRGYQWFGNLHSRNLKDDDDLFQRLTTSSRITAAQWDGATLDEQYPSSPHIMSRYAAGLWRYGRGAGKGVYTWIVGRPVTPGVDHDLLAAAINAADGHGMILNEIYLVSRPTQAEAEAYIRERLSGTLAEYLRFAPMARPRFGAIFGAFTQSPGLNQSVLPEVDYRVYLDMQFHHLVNAPDLADLGCTGYWGTYRAEDTIHPWLFRLTRHYCVEGRREPLAPVYGLTYRPGHLEDGDFTQGLSAWSASCGVTTACVRAYSKQSQGRWGSERGQGDTFAVLPRGARVTQTVRHLVTGAAYTLEFAACDAGDVAAGRVAPRALGAVCELGDGAVADPRRSWTYVDDRSGEAAGKALGAPRINLVRTVFTATAPETTIALVNPTNSPTACLGVNMVSLRRRIDDLDHPGRPVPVYGEAQYRPACTPFANLLAIQRAVDTACGPCVLVPPVPRGRTKDAPARAAWQLSGREAFRLCDTNRIYYLNVSDHFLNRDGTLKDAFYTPDGLSLNAAGRARFDELVKPLLDWFAGPRTTPAPVSRRGYLSLNEGPRFSLRRGPRENYTRWWWDRAVTKCAEADAWREKGGEIDLLLIGDSLSHRWEYEDSGASVYRKLTSRYRVLNIAIGGDRWEQQLWLAQSGLIDGLKPRFVSILLGANNHNYQWTKDSPARTRDGVREIMSVVRSKCPGAQFILYPMLMRLADDPTTNSNRVHDIATGPLLHDLARAEGARWVEFDEEMRTAVGAPADVRKRYTTDFTHLSTYMFERWYEKLEPILAEPPAAR